MSVKKEKKADAKGEAAKYTKKQLMSASRYCDKQDVLMAVLEDKKEYDFQEAEERVNQYMKGKVK